MLIHSLSIIDRNADLLEEQYQEIIEFNHNRDKTLLIHSLEVVPFNQLVNKEIPSSKLIAFLLQVASVTKAMKEQWS